MQTRLPIPKNEKSETYLFTRVVFLTLAFFNPIFSFTDDNADFIQQSDQLFHQTKNFDLDGSSCGLKKAGLIQSNSHWVTKSEPDTQDYFSHATTYFETNQPQCLKEYVVVQFIKGCVYETWVNDDKSKTQRFLMRDFMDKTVAFNHANWVVDTADSDPVYASESSLGADGRHHRYMTTINGKIPEFATDPIHLFQQVNQLDTSAMRKNLFDSPAGSTFAYVTDTPSGGRYSTIHAVGETEQTSSLQFKACIYKTSDVPSDLSRSSELKDFNHVGTQGGPLVCFDWESSYNWNPTHHKMESPKTIDSTCKTMQ